MSSGPYGGSATSPDSTTENIPSPMPSRITFSPARNRRSSTRTGSIRTGLRVQSVGRDAGAGLR